jgi:hypothetical protein
MGQFATFRGICACLYAYQQQISLPMFHVHPWILAFKYFSCIYSLKNVGAIIYYYSRKDFVTASISNTFPMENYFFFSTVTRAPIFGMFKDGPLTIVDEIFGSLIT